MEQAGKKKKKKKRTGCELDKDQGRGQNYLIGITKKVRLESDKDLSTRLISQEKYL